MKKQYEVIQLDAVIPTDEDILTTSGGKEEVIELDEIYL